MSDQSIQGVITFNQELVAFVRAGLPLSFGETASHRFPSAGTRSADSIASMLDQFNTALTIRVGRGQSMEQAVSEEPLLTSNYRKALLTYLRCNDPRLALETLAFPTRTRQRLSSGIASALVYPLIVLTIAFIGFLVLVLVTGPTIESMYQQVARQPPPAVAFLIRARNALPIWGAGIPLLVTMGLLWWNLRGSWLDWKWLPGNHRYYESIQNAHHARQLAGMLEHGCSLEESLTTIFPTSKPAERNLRSSGRRESESRRDQRAETAGPAEAPIPGDIAVPKEVMEQLPPLLRWAVVGDTGEEPLPDVMRFVATAYERTAERSTKTWQVIIPMIVGLVVSGLLVLAYGMSLFLPVIQMLYDLAGPTTGLVGG
jgi:type II secretory pathway component PulF